MHERVTIVTYSVCLSQTDFEDGFVLSPNGHKSTAGDCFKVLNEALFFKSTLTWRNNEKNFDHLQHRPLHTLSRVPQEEAVRNLVRQNPLPKLSHCSCGGFSLRVVAGLQRLLSFSANSELGNY